jgi:hypothetical protein
MHSSSYTTSANRYMQPPQLPPRGNAPSGAPKPSPPDPQDHDLPTYQQACPNGPQHVTNAPAPAALRALASAPVTVAPAGAPQAPALMSVPASLPHHVANPDADAPRAGTRSGIDGWHRRRDSPNALPAGAPELAYSPCGVLPKKVMKELEHVLMLLETVGMKSIAESRRAERALEKATVTLEALKAQAPEPTAPLEMTVGSGLFDGDSSAGVDVVHQKTLRRAEKKVARLEKDMQALAKSFQDQVAALQIKKMKLEASLRPVRVTTASATR